MHQNAFGGRSLLDPLGKFTAIPRSPTWIEGSVERWKRDGWEWKGRKTRGEGKGRERRGGGTMNPQCENPAYANGNIVYTVYTSYMNNLL